MLLKLKFKNMKFQIFTLVFAVVLITSCGVTAKNLYLPLEANASKANLKVEDLVSGRDLYLNECNECHKLNQPKKYTSSEWTSILKKMQPKAEITDSQRGLIFSYLTSEINE